LSIAFSSPFMVLGCGSGSTPGHNEGGVGVPDPGPGNEVDTDFNNPATGTNDTPETATPLGTSTTPDVTVWVGDNQIGQANHKSNYFVFRSGPASGTFLFRGCFSSPLEGLTASLWKVKNGEELLPAVETQSSTADGKNLQCLDFDQPVLEANTVYLFGLTATKGAGLYSL
jgi:hypothetical protein